MTEPLLLAATLVSVLLLREWLIASSGDRVPSSLGWVLFLTTWTRYEAWPILAGAIGVAAFALWRQGRPLGLVVRQTWRLAQWPAAAVVLFLVLSRLTVGAWFVSGGFYERDPTYDAQAVKSLLAIWWGTHRLSGYVIEIVGLTAAAWVVLASRAEPGRITESRHRRSLRGGRAPGVCVLRGASVPDSLHGAGGHGVRVVLWSRGRSTVGLSKGRPYVQLARLLWLPCSSRRR